MKSFLITLLILASATAKSQITFEHHYIANSGSLQVVNLEDEGSKYITYDTNTRNMILYNEDHTVWKTINTLIPTGSKLFTFNCVSTKLFDNDPQVEMSISYYTPATPVTLYATMIIKEDGTIVKSFPDGYYITAAKVNTSWKILVNRVATGAGVDVYSVPGQLLSILKPNSGGQIGEATMYPNPVDQAATLKYSLPSGQNKGVINITNTQGQLLRTYTVTSQFDNIIVSRGNLMPGNYIYSIVVPGYSTVSNVFTIR